MQTFPNSTLEEDWEGKCYQKGMMEQLACSSPTVPSPRGISSRQQYTIGTLQFTKQSPASVTEMVGRGKSRDKD